MARAVLTHTTVVALSPSGLPASGGLSVKKLLSSISLSCVFLAAAAANLFAQTTISIDKPPTPVPTLTFSALSGGTAYVGSYDHRLYALSQATGAARWTFAAGAPSPAAWARLS